MMAADLAGNPGDKGADQHRKCRRRRGCGPPCARRRHPPARSARLAWPGDDVVDPLLGVALACCARAGGDEVRKIGLVGRRHSAVAQVGGEDAGGFGPRVLRARIGVRLILAEQRASTRYPLGAAGLAFCEPACVAPAEAARVVAPRAVPLTTDDTADDRTAAVTTAATRPSENAVSRVAEINFVDVQRDPLAAAAGRRHTRPHPTTAIARQ